MDFLFHRKSFVNINGNINNKQKNILPTTKLMWIKQNLSKSLIFGCISIFFTSLLSCNKDDTIYGKEETEGKQVFSHVKVYEYLPAPGQFVHLVNASSKEEAKAVAEERINDGGLVSLGAFGGFIVVGFGHGIENIPDEYDFAIAGNSFDGNSEPGIVYVMQDENKNGMPDDVWYELKGSDSFSPETIRNYSVTYFQNSPLNDSSSSPSIAWEDNNGTKGSIDLNATFPQWLDSVSYSLSGICLKSKTYFSNMWVNPSFEWGYADNFGQDHNSNNREIQFLTNVSMKNYNCFKIENAVNANGEKVDLKSIDFIKVQCAVQSQGGVIGELSTEIAGFAELSKN